MHIDKYLLERIMKTVLLIFVTFDLFNLYFFSVEYILRIQIDTKEW